MNIFSSFEFIQLSSRPRLAKSLPTYHKTSCQTCDKVIRLDWQRQYRGPTSNIPSFPPLENCPACGSARLQTVPIHKNEFDHIKEIWDFR